MSKNRTARERRWALAAHDPALAGIPNPAAFVAEALVALRHIAEGRGNAGIIAQAFLAKYGKTAAG